MTHILVLCTGNSARSIMAEAYFNHAGMGKVKAFSAGSAPTGQVNPFALATLEAHGIPVSKARSKSWDEFATPEAPAMDIVITVCDKAAKESCPIWPGAPLTYHWPFEDPAAVAGTEAEKAAAFERIFQEIKAAVDAFLAGQSGANIARTRRQAMLAKDTSSS